jgi:hypothetical protein
MVLIFTDAKQTPKNGGRHVFDFSFSRTTRRGWTHKPGGFVLWSRYFFAHKKCPQALELLAFVIVGLLVQPAGLWTQPYHFGRVFAPAILLVFVASVGSKSRGTRRWEREHPGQRYRFPISVSS